MTYKQIQIKARQLRQVQRDKNNSTVITEIKLTKS